MSRSRTSLFAVAWVALFAAALLAAPREFDRVRTVRAGSHRLDCHEAGHGPADDHVPGPLAEAGDDHVAGEVAAGALPALSGSRFAIAVPRVRVALSVPPQYRVPPLRALPLPPGRAPPHL